MTTVTTASITDFLLARLSDEEEIAQGALRDSVDDDGVTHAVWTEASTAVMWGDVAGVSGLKPDYLATHIARHDPARVLADCAARRAIVELHGDDTGVCRVCADWGPYSHVDLMREDWPCPTLRHLASVYADHPEFCEEWKP